MELSFLGLGLELGVRTNDNFTHVRGVIANRIWHVLYTSTREFAAAI